MITKTQLLALTLLDEGPINEAIAITQLGASRRRTLRALEGRGWVRYFPTSETWRITPFGRTALQQELT